MCARIREDLGSQKAIAGKCGIAETTLSEYLSAARFPSEPTLSSLWNLMPDSMSVRRRPIPRTRAELADLHAKADLARRLRRAKDRARARGEAVESPAPRPAPLRIRNRCQKRHLRGQSVAAPAGSAAIAAAGPEDVLPVPRVEGDRQHTKAAESTWAGIEELRRHLLAGRKSAAMTILSNAARAVDAKDVRNAVSACREAGLVDAAHAVLTNAGLREPEMVLSIVGSLHDDQNYEDAAFLTRSATQHTRRRDVAP
ncbi:helix-turn-helix domain-containing protein [Streptomyces sp. NPDC057307]|uniref:helix-turn-helix domain-containing protein n=1 Tax=Streptomyces sp. NPDC057307 TaxID=3346096 RepID=UPI003636EE34